MSKRSAGNEDKEQAGMDEEDAPLHANIDVDVNVKNNEGNVSGVTLGNVTTVNIYGNQNVVAPESQSQFESGSFERKKFEPETIFIPGTVFLMGRQPGPGVPIYESPQTQIELPGFRIGKYPVSNAEYLDYVRDQTRYTVPPELGWEGQKPVKALLGFPVRGVTWQEALDYCDWLKKQTGHSYSLPSEAQWEMAARGLDGRLYPWGETWQDKRSNQGNEQMAGVGAFPAQSSFGLYDLVGNVLQWTTTLWGGKPLQPDDDFVYPWQDDGRDNLEANRQIRRVVRGSAFSDPPEACTCTRRRSFLPTNRGEPGKRHGFRVMIRP